jgi:sulfite exporter TauE/SafE
MTPLWSVFLTGLLTGGLTCMAVQGSLLATALLVQEGRLEMAEAKKYRIAAIAAFLAAKLIAYAILGAFLGFAGSAFSLNPATQLLTTVAVSVFMVGAALNLLNIHPVFRYFALTPPRFLSRFIRRQSKSGFFLTPVILGALTVFLPCGTTQAMMVLAIGSGHAVNGALIMASFILGTTPVFFLLGFIMTGARDLVADKFTKLAASVIILLAVWNLESAVTLTGSRWTIGNSLKLLKCAVSFCENPGADSVSAGTAAVITFSTHGYSIDKPVIKAGEKIRVKLVNQEAYGCIQAFTIPGVGVREVVRTGETKEIEFTAPDKPGELAFMCSMGMYRGTFIVR